MSAVRRVGTWLVVVALGGLGLAATLDALVGDEDAPRRAVARTTTVPLLARQPELAIAQLREAGVRGVLTFSDEDCRLHALSLPELEERRAPPLVMCSPYTQSGGLGAVDGDVVWSGLGYGTVQTVLSKTDLARALERDGRAVGRGYRARQAVSLGGDRYAVVAEATVAPRERVVVLFEDQRLTGVASTLVRENDRLRPSPRGTYVAVLGPAEPGLEVLRASGDPVLLPQVPAPHAVAWSSDETWTALATRESVYLFPSERPDDLVVRVPLAVRDLDWSE